MDQMKITEEMLVVTVKLRGTKNEIRRVKARIAALSSCEEVQSMYMKEQK